MHSYPSLHHHSSDVTAHWDDSRGSWFQKALELETRNIETLRRPCGRGAFLCTRGLPLCFSFEKHCALVIVRLLGVSVITGAF